MEKIMVNVEETNGAKMKNWYENNRTKILVCFGVTAVLTVGGILIFKRFRTTKIQVLKGKLSNCRQLLKETQELTRLANTQKKNSISIKNISSPSKSILPKVTVISRSGTTKTPHRVNGYVRNLPVGWNASAEKIATAAEHGYVLGAHQTWVVEYQTGMLAS